MANVDSLKLSDARSFSKLAPATPTVDFDASPNSLASMSPRSPYVGHVAAVSSVSAVSAMAPPAPPAPATGGGASEGVDVEEPVVPRSQHEAMESNVSITLEDAGRAPNGDTHSMFQNSLRNILGDKEPEHDELRLTTGHYAEPSMEPELEMEPEPEPEPEPVVRRPTKGRDEVMDEAMDEPMNAGDGAMTAGHIAAASSASSVDVDVEDQDGDEDHDEDLQVDYDAMYARGSGNTPGPDEMDEIMAGATTKSGYAE